MRLLAWDTSSKAGALAALEWEQGQQSGRFGLKLVTEWTLNVDATHSERLLWGIHEVLQAARWRLEDVDLFGVGVGPGSFTGLRIGVTTARTLAHSMQKPLIGVSSLAALARPAALWLSEHENRAVIIATTDACKGELFALWGCASAVADCAVLAEGDFPGLWKRGVEEKVIKPDELGRVLKRKLKDTDWLAIGEGRKRYPDLWAGLPTAREMEAPVPFSDHVQGRYIGLLAWEAFQSGLARKALHVFPRYIRASDAELKLRAGLLHQGPTRG